MCPCKQKVLNSEMQAFDKCKSETRNRVGAERCHWTGVLDSVKSEHSSLLSNHQDNTKQLLMAKDTVIAQLKTSKDTEVDKLKGAVQSLMKSMKDQKEDMECMKLDHRLDQRQLRKTLGSVVDSKHDMIKSLRTTLVDQGEMSCKMFDEVNVHKKTKLLMKKKAEDAAKLSTARQEKNKVATQTINSLRDQLAQLQDNFHDKEYQITELVEKCNKYKCRIMYLEDDNMDLLDTIHVSTCWLSTFVFMWCIC